MSCCRNILRVAVSTGTGIRPYPCLCTGCFLRNASRIVVSVLFLRQLRNALCVAAVASGAGVGSDAFLGCRWLLCYGYFIIMSQCCQLFSGTHKFIAVRTIGISCVSGLRAGRFPLIPYFSVRVITFSSCNRNAYTFCLIISLVSSYINRSRRHSHTICKHRVLICLLPAPSFLKCNIANLLCAVCRCHCSFRHVWSFRCLIDRNCYCSSYCIVVVCVIRCKYCLIAFVVYSRNDVRSCKAPCSGK